MPLDLDKILKRARKGKKETLKKIEDNKSFSQKRSEAKAVKKAQADKDDKKRLKKSNKIYSDLQKKIHDKRNK